MTCIPAWLFDIYVVAGAFITGGVLGLAAVGAFLALKYMAREWLR